MNKNAKNEIGSVYNKEKMKVTCVERKYKFEASNGSIIITTKKELDEEATLNLLHEDKELDSLLVNSDITIDIEAKVSDKKKIKKSKITKEFHRPEKIEENIEDSVKEMREEEKVSKYDDKEHKDDDKEHKDDDIVESTIRAVKNTDISKIMKKEPKISEKRSFIETKHQTEERRSLFDSLDLAEEFNTTDYIRAIENKGGKITNTAMPRDDMRFFEKQGKIKKGEMKNGVCTYRKISQADAKESMIEPRMRTIGD